MTDIRRSKIQVLDRSALLIQLLADNPEPLNLKTLSDRSGLHTATCHRLLEAMCVHDLVRRTINPKGYTLMYSPIGRAANSQGRYLVSAAADSLMRSLSRELQGSVRLLFRDGHDLVCGKMHWHGEDCSASTTNFRVKLHQESVGLHWLAHLGVQFVRQYLEALQSLNPPEPIAFASLWSSASKSIAAGYSRQAGAGRSSPTTIGVLIRDRASLPVAAVTITGAVEVREEDALMEAFRVAKAISETAFPIL